MGLLDGNGDPVRAGGSRRVALMFSLDLTHPDIEEFISLKSGDNLHNANLSIKIHDTNKFIDKVLNDETMELSWKGKCKKTIDARRLWATIVDATYATGDPGILNWELVKSESTISYIKDLVTTNPCGEIALSVNESCCLGHLVLPRFVEKDAVNWHLLASTIRTGVRFLDNTLTVNKYPLQEQQKVAESLRRIGLGTTGLADMFILLGIKYGSEESLTFIDKLYRFISKTAYEASVMLAVEKGAFPACKPDMHIKTGYVKRMSRKIKELISEHGIRNAAILTQAPTGTVSILSGNVSSGIEPIFAPAYRRRFYLGDAIQEELVFHPLFTEFMDTGKNTDSFIRAKDLSVEDHFAIQIAVQKHIDNAVSKTINLAEDYPKELLNSVWLRYLPQVKGVTFYREGSKKDAPLTPLSLAEAKKLYKKGTKSGPQKTDNCRGGKCDL